MCLESNPSDCVLDRGISNICDLLLYTVFPCISKFICTLNEQLSYYIMII